MKKYEVQLPFLQVHRETDCLDLTWIHLTELHLLSKATDAALTLAGKYFTTPRVLWK